MWSTDNQMKVILKMVTSFEMHWFQQQDITFTLKGNCLHFQFFLFTYFSFTIVLWLVRICLLISWCLPCRLWQPQQSAWSQSNHKEVLGTGQRFTICWGIHIFFLVTGGCQQVLDRSLGLCVWGLSSSSLFADSDSCYLRHGNFCCHCRLHISSILPQFIKHVHV